VDVGVVWEAIGSSGSVVAAGVAAAAAWISKSSSSKANAAADALADIERDLSPGRRAVFRPCSVRA
jgi:hypothetical protein